jgi:hypothetical protein
MRLSIKKIKISVDKAIELINSDITKVSDHILSDIMLYSFSTNRPGMSELFDKITAEINRRQNK